MSDQAQLDAAAQQMGFKNYAQWSAFNAHQQQMRAAPVAAAPQPAAPQAPPTNWLQNLIQQYTPLGRMMQPVNRALKK